MWLFLLRIYTTRHFAPLEQQGHTHTLLRRKQHTHINSTWHMCQLRARLFIICASERTIIICLHILVVVVVAVRSYALKTGAFAVLCILHIRVDVLLLILEQSGVIILSALFVLLSHTETFDITSYAHISNHWRRGIFIKYQGALVESR